ncbi:unnamed protein product [Symbiodinium natans]|uniref:Uncharacterized protein n=1 Tax=Symbiodinium natans TaxID=878477 RepID=A0A812I3L5_9DINO|nr:unnamed protein product [Symbiodinium natans]
MLHRAPSIDPQYVTCKVWATRVLRGIRARLRRRPVILGLQPCAKWISGPASRHVFPTCPLSPTEFDCRNEGRSTDVLRVQAGKGTRNSAPVSAPVLFYATPELRHRQLRTKAMAKGLTIIAGLRKAQQEKEQGLLRSSEASEIFGALQLRRCGNFWALQEVGGLLGWRLSP